VARTGHVSKEEADRAAGWDRRGAGPATRWTSARLTKCRWG